jgi:hypothetical protein
VWASGPFLLEQGSSVFVNCACQGSIIAVLSYVPPYKLLGYTLNGEVRENGSEAIVPANGLYNIAILNLQTTPITATGFTVIEQTPATTPSAETSYNTVFYMVFNTVQTIVPNLTQVAPYLIVGVLPSAILLLVICVIALFVVLLDQRIISVLVTKKRKTRRKRSK